MKKKKDSKVDILRMLWERKHFYVGGYVVGIICLLICIAEGSEIRTDEMIIIPFSSSFIFGYLLYLIIKDKKRLMREGRSVVLSKEGVINLALTFGSMFVLGLLLIIIKDLS